MGWDPSPYQWPTVGYGGAIRTGRATCGILFGATVCLGYLHGMGATQAPEARGERRSRAIESVRELYHGFIEQFADTDCQTLTGCDWSKEEGRARYRQEKVFQTKCLTYLRHVLEQCFDEMTAMNKPEG